MELSNLSFEEIEQIQSKLTILREQKLSLRNSRKKALMVSKNKEIINPNYFMHNILSLPIIAYPKTSSLLIPEIPEWMAFDKNKDKPKLNEYWYVFDYEFPYITIELIKHPKLIGYLESNLRNELQKVGESLWKYGKHLFPCSAENLINIFNSFQENKTNKWTLRFKVLVVTEIQTFLDQVNLKLEINKITLDNVDEYIRDKMDGKYPANSDGAFKNQKVGLIHTMNFMPFALLWEMGTGKTRTAIETFMYHRYKGNVDKCLVVCPVSVIDNWEQEIYKWSDCSVTVLRGTKEEKLHLLENEQSDFYITNYEGLLTFGEVLQQWIDQSTMIIADESTKIKNPNAKRSKALIKLGRYTKFKMIMTGTPVTQHAYDLFAPFLFLDGGESFGLSHEKFLRKYYWQNGYKLIPLADSLEKISNKMYFKSLRFMKKECIDIPDKVYTQRIVELPPYHLQKYKEMRDYAITQIENSEKVTAAIILVQLLRLSQITSGFVVDENGKETNFTENPKLDALEEILDELDENQKVVIWARFQQDVKNIYILLNKMNIKGVMLYGEIKPEDRDRNIQKFQNDSQFRVLIGTPGTGGLGINLTAASLVIYYSNSYSLQDRLQSEDRVHRAGQTNKVTYIDILAKETIDIGIHKILRSKKDVADVVTKDNLRAII